ncbi:MAG: ABC transporter substrate-binding protein, partial [Syntrophales bacterium]|nr:ABC transporter substrate-binding protein [Syntrophales bacterium]
MKGVKLAVAVGVFALISVFLVSYSFSAETGEPKGKFTYVSPSGAWEFKQIDPHTIVGSSAQEPSRILFDYLLYKDPDGQLVPDLAEKWEISPDGLKTSFYLTKKAKFWDGTPVTAKDVKFSIERCMRPELKFLRGGQLRRTVDRVEVVNDYHVDVHFKQFDPAFIDVVAEYLAIMPKEYTEKVGDDGFAEKPMGSGPFRLVSFRADAEVIAEANTNHHRKVPYIKTVVLKTVKEPATRLAMLKTGEADMIFLFPGHIPEVQKDPGIKLMWTKHAFLRTLIYYDMGFPDEPSPFKDKRVRMAVSYAIDREALSKLLYGAVEPWGSFLAPYHPGYDPSRTPDPYDPKKAKELLAAAGYPNGFDTVFTGHITEPTLWQATVAMLNEVGIRARLDMPEAGTWARYCTEGKFRGIGYGAGPWWAGRGPGSCLEAHVSGFWAPEGHPYPELKESIENLDKAILKGPEEE